MCGGLASSEKRTEDKIKETMEETMVYSEKPLHTLVTTVTTENSSPKLRIAMTSPASISPTKVSYYLCVL